MMLVENMVIALMVIENNSVGYAVLENLKGHGIPKFVLFS